MLHALLVSEKTDLPNKRAFEEGVASPFVAMCDVNGLKALNDGFGYVAGDILIKRFAETLVSVGVYENRCNPIIRHRSENNGLISI